MELSYIAVDTLLKDFAQKHVGINSYCGTSLQELHEMIISSIGFQAPILVFFNYTSRLSGTDQRTFNTRTVSFSILYNQISIDDYQAQREAVNNAEAIGLDIMARINIYSKMQESGWLYNNFDKNTVRYNEIDNAEISGHYGMEFHFEIKTVQPLTVNKAKWSDGNIFC